MKYITLLQSFDKTGNRSGSFILLVSVTGGERRLLLRENEILAPKYK